MPPQLLEDFRADARLTVRRASSCRRGCPALRRLYSALACICAGLEVTLRRRRAVATATSTVTTTDAVAATATALTPATDPGRRNASSLSESTL